MEKTRKNTKEAAKQMLLENRLSYINALDVDVEPILLVTDGETAKPSASVDAGEVISFVDEMSGQSRSDVLNSCLLAQLAANKKYDKEKQMEEWYKYYREVMENVGWVVQEFEFEKYEAKVENFTMEEFLTDLVYVMCGTTSELLMRAIQSLKSGPKSLSSQIFDSFSHGHSKGNFQLGHCTSRNGVVTMNLGATYFSVNDLSETIFFIKFSKESSDIYSGSQEITLDNDVYSAVRYAVIFKLGDRASQFIADLDI